IAALAHHDAVSRRLEVHHGDGLAASAHGVEGGLVDQVGQIGATHPGRPAGDQLEVDVGGQALVLAVDLQDREPLLHVWKRDHDLAVETAGEQQGGIEDVGPVGGGYYHDVFGRVE